MRRVRKITFEELVKENKERILQDEEEMERLERRWERRRAYSPLKSK